MGIYLPPSLQTPLVIGAILGYFLNKKMFAEKGEDEAESGKRRGTLFASGLIVGESIIGILMAAIIVLSISNGGSDNPLSMVGDDFSDTAEWLGLAVFVLFMAIFSRVVLKKI